MDWYLSRSFVASDGVVDSWTNITQASSAPTPDEVLFFDGNFNSVQAVDDLTDEVWYLETVDHSSPGDVYYDQGTIARAFADALASDLNSYSGSVALDDRTEYLFVVHDDSSGFQPINTINVIPADFPPFGPLTWEVLDRSDSWERDQTDRPHNIWGNFNLVYIYTETASSGSSAPTVPEPGTAMALALLGIVGFANHRRRRRLRSL